MNDEDEDNDSDEDREVASDSEAASIKVELPTKSQKKNKKKKGKGTKKSKNVEKEQAKDGALVKVRNWIKLSSSFADRMYKSMGSKQMKVLMSIKLHPKKRKTYRTILHRKLS